MSVLEINLKECSGFLFQSIKIASINSHHGFYHYRLIGF